MRLLAVVFLAELWATPSAGSEVHGAPVTQVIFPLINFLIFLYLLKRFLLPVIRDHLRSRHEEILTSVKEAGESRQRAETMVREYQGRLARLDEEVMGIREGLCLEGEKEKTKLLAEAQELGSQINADAAFLAEQEVKLARQRLRQEVAYIAQEAAAKIVRRELKSEDERRLVEEFLSGVGGVR